MTTECNDFIASICHELKTPASAMEGFAYILESEIKSAPSIANRDLMLDYIEEIKIAADDLKGLIRDLLDFGYSSNAEFSIDMSKEINIADAVKSAMKINHSYAMTRGIMLKSEISSDVKPVKLDIKRMKQILSNLVSNALKYSNKNTEVKIFVKINEEKNLEISLVDQGFGMTEDQIKMAFEKYKTIKNPNSKSVDSFGLGLPIVKDLVEKQGGKIEIKSAVGVGTEVSIRFGL